MSVKHEETVQQYANHHSEMVAMLENLSEFVATMPAPDENMELHGQGIDYGYTGDVARIHSLLKQANDIAYEMTE